MNRHDDEGKNQAPETTPEQGGFADQFEGYAADDAFLTELSTGIDPSDGADELAALFLALRAEVERPMPPAPQVAASARGGVSSLDEERSRRRGGALMHGLVGAAAATLLIAGAGAVAVNTGMINTRGSDEVELASTLDKMESRSAAGDLEGVRQLLVEARKLVGENTDRTVSDQAQASAKVAGSERETTTVLESARTSEAGEKTSSVTPQQSQPGEPQAVTLTEHVTETSVQTVTVTVSPSESSTEPTRSLPTAEPTEPHGDGKSETAAPAAPAR